MSDRDIEVAEALGRIEQKVDALHGLKEEVAANTRFRWRATAVGSFIIAVLGWFGFIR